MQCGGGTLGGEGRGSLLGRRILASSGRHAGIIEVLVQIVEIKTTNGVVVEAAADGGFRLAFIRVEKILPLAVEASETIGSHGI